MLMTRRNRRGTKEWEVLARVRQNWPYINAPIIQRDLPYRVILSTALLNVKGWCFRINCIARYVFLNEQIYVDFLIVQVESRKSSSREEIYLSHKRQSLFIINHFLTFNLNNM